VGIEKVKRVDTSINLAPPHGGGQENFSWVSTRTTIHTIEKKKRKTGKLGKKRINTPGMLQTTLSTGVPLLVGDLKGKGVEYSQITHSSGQGTKKTPPTHPNKTPPKKNKKTPRQVREQCCES